MHKGDHQTGDDDVCSKVLEFSDVRCINKSGSGLIWALKIFVKKENKGGTVV